MYTDGKAKARGIIHITSVPSDSRLVAALLICSSFINLFFSNLIKCYNLNDTVYLTHTCTWVEMVRNNKCVIRCRLTVLSTSMLAWK